MDRLTHDGATHRIDPKGLAGVPADARDDAMLERVRALGFRDLGVVWCSVVLGPDDEDEDEDAGVPEGLPTLSVPVPTAPFDLVGVVEPDDNLVVPTVVLVLGADPTIVAGVETLHGHTWLALYTLFEDGTMVRTISRPVAVHHEHLDEIASTFPFARPPSLKALLVKAASTAEDAPMFDRPKVGSFNEVYDSTTSPSALLARHRERVALLKGGREVAALDDLTLVVAVFRRSMHVTFEQMSRAQGIADTVQMVAGWCVWLALVLVLHPILDSVVRTVLLAAAIRFTGNATWRFFVGDSPRPAAIFGVIGLGMAWAWGIDPLRWGVLVLLAGVAEACRVLAWLAMGGGPLSVPVVRTLSKPGPVPARQLQFAYRD